jgi:hypothetical protein
VDRRFFATDGLQSLFGDVINHPISKIQHKIQCARWPVATSTRLNNSWRACSASVKRIAVRCPVLERTKAVRLFSSCHSSINANRRGSVLAGSAVIVALFMCRLSLKRHRM